MLKISKQTREAYIKLEHNRLHDWVLEEVRKGGLDNTPKMQALEAFRRETRNAALSEAGEIICCCAWCVTAIEALKEEV